MYIPTEGEDAPEESLDVLEGVVTGTMLRVEC